MHNFFSLTHYRYIFGFPALSDEQISCFTNFSQIFFRISCSDWRANFFEYSSILKLKIDQVFTIFDQATSVPGRFQSFECRGKPYLLKAQHSAFNISDSTTIHLTVQNRQITSFVPDSTDLVVESNNKCLAVRTVGMQRCPGFHKNVRFAK